MAPSTRTLGRGFAAVFSSLVLLGPLTIVVLVGAPVIVLETVGLVAPPSLEFVWIGASGVAALWLAIEGAAVQLYGFAVLDRGGPSLRTARYLLIGVTALSGLVVAVRFLVLALPWAIDTGSLSAQVLGVAVVVALAASLYRTAVAARRGYVTARGEQ